MRKGGSIIQQESDKIGYVQVGSAVITTSGKLPCNAVIHTVGPRMGEGNEDSKLRKAVQSSLKLRCRSRIQKHLDASYKFWYLRVSQG